MYPELRLPLVVALAAALAFVAFLVLGRPVLRTTFRAPDDQGGDVLEVIVESDPRSGLPGLGLRAFGNGLGRVELTNALL